MTHYQYKKKDRKKRNGYWLDLYVFRGANNLFYFVEVEQREHYLHVVKFFLKQHRHSDNRYSLVLKNIYKDNQTGAFHFIRVLNTLLKLSEEYYLKNNKVSFGFMGAPKLEEKDSNGNPDGTYSNTQRFRIYKTFSLNYFSEDKFEHIQFESSSCYLIRNKKNESLTLDRAKKLLNLYMDS